MAIDDFISACAKRDIVTQIGFTGGEPFLKREMLLHGLTTANSYNLPSGIVTSGYWARSEESTQRTISELRELGLKILVVSMDSYHQKFVDLDKVIRAAKIAGQLGVQFLVYACFNDQLEKDRIYQDFKKIRDVNIDAKIEWRSVSNVGNATAIYSGNFTMPFNEVSGICPSDTIINVWPDGSVLPCCSAYTNASLAVGVYPQKSADELVELILTSQKLKAIRKGNIKKISSLADKSLLLRRYENTCHLCHDLCQIKDFDYNNYDFDPIDDVVFG